MLRGLALFAVFFGLTVSANAQPSPVKPPRPLASALSAAEAGRWDTAARLAERGGPAAEAIIEYNRLFNQLGTPDEIMRFLRENPVWPGLDSLKRRNEEIMARGTPDQVLEFYDTYTARSGLGVLGHVAALIRTGQEGDAKANLVLAWRTLDLTSDEHDTFVNAFPDLLEPHHEARLRMALWRGLRDVKQMEPLVDKELQAISRAWQKIEDGATIRNEDLPEGAATEPGIAYHRFEQHMRKGREAQAIDILNTQSVLEGGLGQPERWSNRRRQLARSTMRAGEPDLAYQIAAQHQLVDGSAFADLEWLAGYIALRYLEAPDLALDHFQRFRTAVATPISLGRAGYWIGRAQEALDDPEAAQDAYAFGAAYPTSFYGLLAAEKAGVSPAQALRGTAPDGDWKSADFAGSKLFKAGVLYMNMGRISIAERYFVALAGHLETDDIARLGQALADFRQPHLQVMVGKAAAKRGLTVPGPYYALHPMVDMDLAVEDELALAIARRESEFDFTVVSGAGAEGLMQLMPRTAQGVAKSLGVSHTQSRVLSDWTYNAQLGSAYLAELIEQFDGNIIMVSAGYNAGPSRPIKWMELFGDPRQPGAGMVDWIEHIPFRETRNYVMRVSESLPVYRARLGKAPHPVPFSEEIAGSALKVIATQ